MRGLAPGRERPLRHPRGTGAVGLAATERRAVVSNDVLLDPRLQLAPEIRAYLEETTLRAVLAVPLTVKEQVVGALGLVDVAGRIFSVEDVQLARALADQASVALENARLYADAEQRRLEGETLSGLVRTISATLDLAAVMRHVAAAARELCGSDIAHILLRDAETDTMSAQYGVGHNAVYTTRIERGNGAGGTAWSTGRPFRTADRPADPRVSAHYAELVALEGIVSTLVVPIWISGQVEGLLYVENRTPRAFTDRDEAILMRLADHAAVAIQNATLYQRLQGLSGRLMEVQEAERRHLARELHDEIGQLLTGLRLTLDLPEPPSSAMGERLEQARGLVEELLDRVRALSLDLRPSILDDLGLLPALLEHVERYTSQTKVRVRLEHHGLDQRFDPETETGVYRIVQEALTNVARHSGVDEVTVRLWATHDVLGVQVEDHGRGFDPDTVLGNGGSGGLAGLRERAALLSGHLTVETQAGRWCATDRGGADRRLAPAGGRVSIRIVLAEDHHVVRQGLRALLAAEPDFEVVGEAASGLEVAPLVERVKPDVLVVDFVMPGLNAPDIVRRATRLSPRTRALVLSMHANPAYVVEAMQSGAAGYVLKGSSAAELVRAIRAVAGGERHLSPPLSEEMVESYAQRAVPTGLDLYRTLTQREREVLHLAAEGQTSAQIGARLNISPRTVEVHRANLMRKLGLRGQGDLVRYALGRGILTVDG